MKKREQGHLLVTLDAVVPLAPYRKLDQLLPFNELSLAYRGFIHQKVAKKKDLSLACEH